MDEARGIKSYSSDKQFLCPQPPSPLFRFRAFALETSSGRGPPEMNSVVSCWRNATMCSAGTIFVFTRSQMNRTSSPAAAPASVPSPLERPPKIPTSRRSKKKWSSPVSNQMSQPQGNNPKKKSTFSLDSIPMSTTSHLPVSETTVQKRASAQLKINTPKQRTAHPPTGAAKKSCVTESGIEPTGSDKPRRDQRVRFEQSHPLFCFREATERI